MDPEEEVCVPEMMTETHQEAIEMETEVYVDDDGESSEKVVHSQQSESTANVTSVELEDANVIENETVITLMGEENVDTTSEEASLNQDDLQEDEDEKEPLSYELQQGFRILKELMSETNKSLNWPFMEPVDTEQLGLWDYYERVSRPMWLKKSKYKFFFCFVV